MLHCGMELEPINLRFGKQRDGGRDKIINCNFLRRWRRRRVDPTPRAHDSTTPTRRHWKETILDPSSRHMQAEYGYLSWILPLQIGPAPRYTQSLLIGTWDMRLEPHICVCFMFVYILNIFTITRANFDAYCKC